MELMIQEPLIKDCSLNHTGFLLTKICLRGFWKIWEAASAHAKSRPPVGLSLVCDSPSPSLNHMWMLQTIPDQRKETTLRQSTCDQ